MRSIQREQKSPIKNRIFGLFAALLCCAYLASGCLVLVGSDRTVTFSITPTRGISSLQIHDSFRVKIQSGGQERFDFTIDDNLRAYINMTEEEPGEWTLRLLPGVEYNPKQLDVLITTNTLARLTLNQNANVEISGFQNVQTPISIKVKDNAIFRWSDRVQMNGNLDLEINQDAQISFLDLQLATSANALCRCQGGQLVLNGSAYAFSLTARGQHISKLIGFSVQSMDAKLFDASAAEVTVQATLTVSLFGTSSLLYSGEPEVQLNNRDKETSITQKKSGN